MSRTSPTYHEDGKNHDSSDQTQECCHAVFVWRSSANSQMFLELKTMNLYSVNSSTVYRRSLGLRKMHTPFVRPSLEIDESRNI